LFVYVELKIQQNRLFSSFQTNVEISLIEGDSLIFQEEFFPFRFILFYLEFFLFNSQLTIEINNFNSLSTERINIDATENLVLDPVLLNTVTKTWESPPGWTVSKPSPLKNIEGNSLQIMFKIKSILSFSQLNLFSFIFSLE